MRTFGALTYQDGSWSISATPDVMMRLKRIFPRVSATSRGVITVKDCIEVTRDLEWVMERWPLEVSDADAERIAAGSGAHRRRGETVTAILEGRSPTSGMGLEPARALYDYQRTAHDLIHATGGVLIADELGLGKTTMGLSVLTDPAKRPALAVTLAGALPRQWVRECAKVFPTLRAVEVTKATPYDLSEDGVEPDLIVMNYSKLPGWADHLAGKVRSVIFDEVQELRRTGTAKHTAAARIAHSAQAAVGLSATPVFNYGGEMYSILSVLRPDLVGNRSEFSREWCDTVYGMDDKTRIREPEAFRAWLIEHGAFLRRTRKEVNIPMPALHTREVDLEVSGAEWDARLVGSDIAQIASLVLSGTHREKWLAKGELDYRMRHETGVLKAPYVADYARLVLQSQEKIILAGWHRDVWNIWLERLADFNPVMYTGSESPAAKKRAFDAFTHGDSRILMLSLRSGAGLDGIQHIDCNYALFGELDWSPGVHKQVLGRMHRPGQTGEVHGLFFVTDYGADPIMRDTLDIKAMDADALVGTGDARSADAAAAASSLEEMARSVLARQAA